MKKLFVLFALILSFNSFAGSIIQNWSNDFKISESQANDMIFDFYILDVWWEDEAYECGGDFTNMKVYKVVGDTYYVSGNVSVVQDYCAYESTGFFDVKLINKSGSYVIEEISFQDDIGFNY